MAGKTSKDEFANVATISLTQATANTLIFKKLETGNAIFNKVAWLIHRIEYCNFHVYASIFNGDNDSLVAAVTSSNVRTSLLTLDTYTDMAVIDQIVLYRNDFGTAASALVQASPILKDFSNLPGSGLLVPAMQIYGALHSSGLADVASGVIKLFYTVVELADAQYWELVQARTTLTA